MVLDQICSVFASRYLLLLIDLAALGNPSVIAFAAQIKQGGFTVSKTGWHILVLK